MHKTSGDCQFSLKWFASNQWTDYARVLSSKRSANECNKKNTVDWIHCLWVSLNSCRNITCWRSWTICNFSKLQKKCFFKGRLKNLKSQWCSSWAGREKTRSLDFFEPTCTSFSSSEFPQKHSKTTNISGVRHTSHQKWLQVNFWFLSFCHQYPLSMHTRANCIWSFGGLKAAMSQV